MKLSCEFWRLLDGWEVRFGCAVASLLVRILFILETCKTLQGTAFLPDPEDSLALAESSGKDIFKEDPTPETHVGHGSIPISRGIVCKGLTWTSPRFFKHLTL